MKLPLKDSRLSEERYRRELARMAREAGWAERGGLLIRDPHGNPVDRTRWIPVASWYQAMQQDEGARIPGGRNAVEKAVELALRGWRMTPQQRRTVTWMLHEAEGFFAECAEAQAASF